MDGKASRQTKTAATRPADRQTLDVEEGGQLTILPPGMSTLVRRAVATEYVSTICADSATAVGVFTPLSVKLDFNRFCPQHFT